MNFLSKILSITLITLPIFNSNALEKITIVDTPQAINIAGKQRMLTQRMLKNYTLLAMNKGVSDEKQLLAQDIQTFNQVFEELNRYTDSINYSIDADKIEMYWGMLQQLLATKPAKIVIPELQRGLDSLLDETNKYTIALTKRSGQYSSKIINLSGKQRMYSQRLANLYFINLIGINDKDFQTKLKHTIKSFDMTQKTLEGYKSNTEIINKKLKKVKLSFNFFKDLAKGKIKTPMPLMINLNSNAILINMDEITKEYSKIAQQPKWGKSPI